MECSCILLLFLFILTIFILLYNVSTTFHYYTRITAFYLSIFLHGIECNLTMIPSYLRGDGADYIFHSFYYWCKWTGVNVEVRGFDENLKELKGPAVVICNHQSAVDVVAMTSIWPPKCAVMMKKSLMYIPFFNVSSWLANSIFIDRFNKEKALESVVQCSDQLMKRDLKLWVFPEGTRYRDHGMLPFKRGAFNIAIKAQVPIVPIVCSNYKPFYSKSDKYFRSDGEVVAQVLPPVATKGLTLDDVPQLTEKIRQQMLEVYDKISVDAAEKMRIKRGEKKLN